MALLMLSLTKSILVVKLLHHSEQEVKQMSLSACLLHRYGAGGGPEVLTSIGTLDSVDPSEGERLRPSKTSQIGPVVSHAGRSLTPDYELETSLEEDLLALREQQKAPSGLEWLLQELASLRLALQQEEVQALAQADWLDLCLKLDRVLFWVYLLVLLLYAGTLMLLWTSWSFA